MYKIDKEAFRRYFFWGNFNQPEALEGIIFYAYEHVFFDQYVLGKHEEMSEQKLINAFAETIKPLYRQYCRFIELNYRKDVTSYLEVDEKQIEKIILNKIEELRNTEDSRRINIEGLHKTEGLERRLEQAIQREKEVAEEKTRQKYKMILEKMEQTKTKRHSNQLPSTKKLNIKGQDIFYSSNQRARFGDLPQGVKPKGEYLVYDKQTWEPKKIPYDLETWYPEQENELQDTNNNYQHNKSKHWAITLAKLLEVLTQIEKQDPKAYEDLWFRTRLHMAKHGKMGNLTEEEFRWIENKCKEIRKERLLEEKEQQFEI